MAQINTIFSGSSFILKALLITVALCAIWLLINLKALREYIDTNAQRRAEQEQIDVLKRRIDNLHAQQLSLVSGGLETERQVRERFHMHKPGEQVIFLEEETAPTSSSSLILPDPTRPDSAPDDAATTAAENSQANEPQVSRRSNKPDQTRPSDASGETPRNSTPTPARMPARTPNASTPSRAPSTTLPAPGSPRVNRILLNENGARAD